VNLIHSTSDVV